MADHVADDAFNDAWGSGYIVEFRSVKQRNGIARNVRGAHHDRLRRCAVVSRRVKPGPCHNIDLLLGDLVTLGENAHDALSAHAGDAKASVEAGADAEQGSFLVNNVKPFLQALKRTPPVVTSPRSEEIVELSLSRRVYIADLKLDARDWTAF